MKITLDPKLFRSLLRQALEEDAAWDDRTTYATVPSGFKTRGEILAKSEGILAGMPVVQQVFQILDKR